MKIVLLLITIIHNGSFKPTPLDELTINLNMNGSPYGNKLSSDEFETEVKAAKVSSPAGSQDGSPTIWAVLVAGSEGWDNYRHQADVCHAYQILHEHGVDDDHIIVIMKDDIANNPKNPFPGNIINRPGGPNVYTGVPKDYIGNSVTPEVFMAVLQGDKSFVSGKGSGKVVESGPNDHVFVYFSDHGAQGIVGFPNAYLDAFNLNKAIGKMREDKKFGSLLFYMESCEAGSMFKGFLRDNIGVLGVTATNAVLPSLACYWDAKRNTFLGDVFSVNWMEDSDSKNISEWSVNQQIATVKKETTESPVSQYGEASIGKMMVGQFQGMNGHVGDDYKGDITDAVLSHEVPLQILQNIGGDQMEEEIEQLMKKRKFVDDIVEEITLKVLGDSSDVNEILHDVNEITNFDCYSIAVKKFHESCFNLGKNNYALRKVHVLVNLCESQEVDEEDISKGIEEVCKHDQVVDTN